MALSALAYWIAQIGAVDTNGGGFDAGQTAGMNTDGAATVATGNSPVFTSASYTFVSGDVGARVFIGAGTNWTKGWYPIASVSAGAATLTASVGTASAYPMGTNSAAGCATAASPTGATWSIDYSFQTSPQISYTDLVIDAVTNTDATSVAFPLGKQMVGNFWNVTAGTGFTVQRVTLTSIPVALTGRFDKSLGTLASTGGTAKMGGSLLSPSLAGAIFVGGNTLMVRYNASAFSSTSATANIAAGRFSVTVSGTAANNCVIRGFDSVPGDETGNRPTLKWGVNAASVGLIGYTGSFARMENMVLDGNRGSFTGTRGVSLGAGNGITFRGVKFTSFLSGAVAAPAGAGYDYDGCEFADCLTTNVLGLAASVSNNFRGCSFHDNQVSCIQVGSGRATLSNVQFYNNTGASTSAVTITGAGYLTADHVTVGTVGQHGFDFQVAPTQAVLTNCHVQGASGTGFSFTSYSDSAVLAYCSGYNNTTANYTVANVNPANVVGFLTPGSDPLTSAGTGNLSPTLAGGLQAAASPSAYPGTLSLSYADRGAVQHQDAGGSTYVYNVME